MVFLPVVYLELCQDIKMYDSDRAGDIIFVKYKNNYLYFRCAILRYIEAAVYTFYYITFTKYKGRYLYFYCIILV